jgi:hypothetical protein
MLSAYGAKAPAFLVLSGAAEAAPFPGMEHEGPLGLKPAPLLDLGGTAEAVPFQNCLEDER